MKIKMRNPLVVLLGLGCLLDVAAQEDVPLGDVRDSMQDPEVSPTDIPSTAPDISDIDRLFGDSSAVNDDSSAGQADEMSELENSLNAPLDQEIILDASDLISVDYPSEEIKTVLRNVADLYMLNLVIPDTVQGSTSIKLRDVTWRQIFNVVLDPVGYTFVEDGSIIKVVSKDSLSFEPPVTEIFMINYADATSIASTVQNLVDAAKGGKVQIDKRSNALIVSERASQMESIREVISRLDKPTQQVFIETRFIEVTNTDVKNIGLSWSSLRAMNFQAGPFGTTYNDDFNRANVSDGSNERIDATNLGDVNLTGAGGSVRTPGTVSARLVDNISGQTLLDATSIAQNNLITTAISQLGSLVDTKGLTRNHSAVFSVDQFGFVLSALKEQGGSKLISNPTIVTLNNQEATINIGEEYPIPSYQYNEETGGFEVSDFEFKKIGVILKVTPSVNHNGLITLKVTPEVSSRTGVVSFGGAGNAQIPIISTRTASTQIALKDGYTMGIGGLMESSNIDNGSQVPILGKIPGLKKLFSHESKEKSKRNLLIFITARILPSEEADFEDVFSQEMISDVGLDPMTLKNR